MSIKNKIVNAITTRPKLVTFGIGLAVNIVAMAATTSVTQIVPAFANGGCHTCSKQSFIFLIL